MSKTYIVYHMNNPKSPCVDGLTSAWVAKKVYPGAILKGAMYQHDQSDPILYAEEGDKLIIVDFSFPQDIIDTLVWNDIDVRIIDHHEGAWEMLQSLEHQLFKFDYDDSYSGCTLTWKKFFPDKEAPAFLKYIEANDTRNKFYFANYDLVKAVTAGIWEMGHSFQTYETLQELSDEEIKGELYEYGKPAWEERKAIIEELMQDIVFEDFEGYESIPRIRLKSKVYKYRSDICEIFLMANPEKPFMVASDMKDLDFSLRSYKFSPNETDVKLICKRHGGGGHKHAAGFTLRQK